MKEILFKFYKQHIGSNAFERLQRVLVLAVKKNAGTLTLQDQIELDILQTIRSCFNEIPKPIPFCNNDLFWPQRA